MRGDWQGAGPPVVLLHGQPGGAQDWALVLPHLHGLRLLVPDRPGYDQSAAGGFMRNAEALITLLDTTQVPRVVVVGHSWAGGVALRLALDRPGRVAGLCLVGSVGSALAITRTDRLLSRPGVRQLAGLVASSFTSATPGLLARVTGSHLPPSRNTQLRAAASGRSMRDAARAFAVEQQALVCEGRDLTRRLRHVDVPCLVVSGTRDRTVRPAASADLAARIPGAVLHTLPGGHLLPVEHPQLLAEQIRLAVQMADW